MANLLEDSQPAGSRGTLATDCSGKFSGLSLIWTGETTSQVYGAGRPGGLRPPSVCGHSRGLCSRGSQARELHGEKSPAQLLSRSFQLAAGGKLSLNTQMVLPDPANEKFSHGYKNRRDHLFSNILKNVHGGVRCYANENNRLVPSVWEERKESTGTPASRPRRYLRLCEGDGVSGVADATMCGCP